MNHDNREQPRLAGKIHLLGVGENGLAPLQRQRLEGCGLVVTAERHRHLAEGPGRSLVPIIPLSRALEQTRAALAATNVAVLASGDPLFFGIGRKLRQTFGPERLEVLPALSFLQLAFARFSIPWDDTAFLSLHGRKVVEVAPLLLRHPKLGLFTDQEHGPDRLAEAMQRHLTALGHQRLLDDYQVMVAERLGEPGERLVTGSLAEIADQRFSDPNVVLLVRPRLAAEEDGPLGLDEEQIAHQRGLITKDEVRATILHRLRLPARGVLWDVGAGSGSISLEAARLAPALLVYAVERDPERARMIKENCRRFGVFNLLTVTAEAPAALASLPAPDRVFIGGSGGRLAEIIEKVRQRLQPDGRLVLSAVTEQTRRRAPSLLAAHSFRVEASEVRVRRICYDASPPTTRELNPITIITGRP